MLYPFLHFLFLFHLFVPSHSSDLPIIISTWATPDFQAAAQRAYDSLLSIPEDDDRGQSGSSPDSSFRRLNALVEGLSECERRRCDRTVGYGGSPDERGETTLDALLMDGPQHRSGAVAAMRRVKSAARVAWAVMNFTGHSLLVGEKATEFAVAMGFAEQSLSTMESEKMHREWLNRQCQPNFWKNVEPDPGAQCGPYKPKWDPKGATNLEGTPRMNWKHILLGVAPPPPFGGPMDHDTLGMVLVDERSNVAAGTSSNGASHKIPGRVGDSPIVGSGAYVDNEVGGAAATGDGDVMMRFVPSFFVVEQMRAGKSPAQAARAAIARIRATYPKFSGALVAANAQGEHGAACAGIRDGFGYSVVRRGAPERGRVRVERVKCD